MRCQPFPGDRPPVDSMYTMGDQWFIVDRQDQGHFCIYDQVQGFEADIHVSRLHWDAFSIRKWFTERCAVNSELDEPWGHSHHWMLSQKWEEMIMGSHPVRGPSDWIRDQKPMEEAVELGGIQVDKGKYPAL